MAINPSVLRQNIYKRLDHVIETGVPLEIKRKGHTLKRVPLEPVSKLASRKPTPESIVGNPEALLTIDGSQNWKPEYLIRSIVRVWPAPVLARPSRP
ncbi:MAG: hypothetical protein CSA22_06465 [Deltaproteobacteria bacterium]|nr:MAG: hypothetical protein CSA22_06465 [Deltaproteobacteria bacterium]